MRRFILAVVVIGVCVPAMAQPGPSACCYTPPPGVVGNLTGVSLWLNSPGTLTFTTTLTVPSGTFLVVATLVKTTFAYGPPCSSIAKVGNSGFLAAQLPATGMTVQPVVPVQGREMSWKTSGGAGTVTLPMNMLLQPYFGSTCSSANPQRNAEVCIRYRVYSQMPCGGILCCSLCEITKSYAVKWNNNGVISFTTTTACP